MARGGGDLRRRGDGDREVAGRLSEADGTGESEPPGGGVGSRTADCSIVEAIQRGVEESNCCSGLLTFFIKWDRSRRAPTT
jgi:hypothetical protein